MSTSSELSNHSIGRTIMDRRSWRIFTSEPLDGELLATLDELNNITPSVQGRRSARLRLVHGEEAVAALTEAATGGLVGAVNRWLRATPPGGFAVLVGDTDGEVRHDGDHFYNVDAAILGQLAVLAATEQGWGSCWMAAVNARRAMEYLTLPRHQRVPAIVALGKPGIRKKGSLMAASWDRFTRIAISGRRKAREKICFGEAFGHPFPLPLARLEELPRGSSVIDLTGRLQPSAEFAGQSPSLEALAQVVEAIRLAPSADNAQTWRLVVVRGSERTAAILRQGGVRWPDHQRGPGTLIVMVAAPFVFSRVRAEQPFSLIDHPLALTQALLVAQSLELHWNVSFAVDRTALARHVGAPPGHRVTALMALDGDGTQATAPYPPWVQLF